MSEQKVFEAIVGKEGGWWNIWVPEIDQVTCTRKSRKISSYTRTLIAAVLGIPESSFRVERELVSAAEFERRYTAAVRNTNA
ncbi:MULTISPECIES: hypothetical protein [Micrococcaceae]|uniref:Uncharacterized protein n=1 Tax=Glutamicibacter ectropisis TaxID=3046593 RepID=A0AAU6WCR7_9MICC|nr:hypothetical protein [Arthrobacter sp. NIO-1057]KSU65885.1 hypothetical protein AS038_09300 [Arthrobacter sp. NIO-1057]SCC26734.1 hypothetical protein GA0061084_1892 [Arthrobacter sp. NIO-1057]